mmetsp:Transcript_4822/g.13013  ORF Transcript_4822/g.13013 Transcript_4822/m.13013 type:complete len:294 (+) Transcript_4822:559-1440(+)
MTSCMASISTSSSRLSSPIPPPPPPPAKPPLPAASSGLLQPPLSNAPSPSREGTVDVSTLSNNGFFCASPVTINTWPFLSPRCCSPRPAVAVAKAPQPPPVSLPSSSAWRKADDGWWVSWVSVSAWWEWWCGCVSPSSSAVAALVSAVVSVRLPSAAGSCTAWVATGLAGCVGGGIGDTVCGGGAAAAGGWEAGASSSGNAANTAIVAGSAVFVSGVAALRAAIHWLLDAAHGEGVMEGTPEDGPRAKGLVCGALNGSSCCWPAALATTDWISRSSRSSRVEPDDPSGLCGSS